MIEHNGRINVYVVALCYASVCVAKDATPDEIVAAVDHSHPTGLRHGWSVSKDATFRTGEPNPCVCHDDAARLHYLLEC